MIATLPGFGQDLASECAAGDAAACAAYYAQYNAAHPVTNPTTAAPVPSVAQVAATYTPQSLAAAIGGTVITVPNLGPFGGSETYVVDASGTYNDPVLLANQLAEQQVNAALNQSNYMLTVSMTGRPPGYSIEQWNALSATQQASVISQGGLGPAATGSGVSQGNPPAITSGIPEQNQPASTTATSTSGAVGTSNPSWLPSFLSTPLQSVSTSTGLSDTTLLIIAAAVIGVIFFMGRSK